MLWLKHHCPICGIDVEKDSAIKRFGKYFCSEEHALQYTERKTREEEQDRINRQRREERGGGRRGGCC